MALVSIVTAISNDLVSRLAGAGLPPLTDGQIVLGKAKKPENSFPPRVIFVPMGARWEDPSPGFGASPVYPTNAQAPGSGLRSLIMTNYGGGYSGTPSVTISAPDVAGGVTATATATVTSNGAISGLVLTNAGSGYVNVPTVTISGTGTGATAAAYLRPTPQGLSGISQRSIRTEWHKFEVHCWGCSSTNGVPTPDVNLDYDATQLLYQQVIASIHSLAAGVYAPDSGQWVDAQDDATLVDVVGHDFVFNVEIALPLLAEPMPATSGASVQFGPVGTQPSPTLYFIPFSGGVLISNATNASPIQITTATPHGLSTGDHAVIGGVKGTTAANGLWSVHVVDSLNFTLDTSTGNGAYTSGGVLGAGTATAG